MFKSNWSAYATIGALALLFSAFGFFLGRLDLPQQQSEHSAYSDTGSPNHGNAKLQSVETASSGSPKGTPEKEASQNPKWWEQDDLDAQTEMATWAKVMAVITGVGVIITGVGVALVWGTLHYTGRGLRYMRRTLVETNRATRAAKQTVEETRNIGRKQVRAYVSFESGTYTIDEDALRMKLTFRNHGQSPARDVWFLGNIRCFASADSNETDSTIPIFFSAENLYHPGTIGYVPAGGNDEMKITCFFETVGTLKIFSFVTKDTLFCLEGDLVWSDVFDEIQTINLSVYQDKKSIKCTNLDRGNSSGTLKYAQTERQRNQ